MAYPPYRQAAASCYDTSRKQWFIFDGAQGLFTGAQMSDQWARAQTGVWTSISGVASTPNQRAMVGACYLPTQDRYLITCGRILNSYTSDTFWYNPATNVWTTKTSAPQTRAYFGNIIWDTVNSRAVLHGGYNGGALSNTILYNPASDTWTDLGTLSPGPGAVGAGWMAFNSVRGVTVYFGGDNLSARQNKTFEFNGSTWTDRTTTGTKPPVRRSLGMWYDPVADALFVHGGDQSTEFGAALQDFWKGVYNNSTNVYDWTQLTTPALPSGPSGRSYYSIAGYDPDRGCGYIWGGEDNAVPVDGQGWSYFSATGKWKSDYGRAGAGHRSGACNGGFGG